ncbi:hypothetical protein [Microbacterium hominis]|uniref:hypothetical protein n=1 Tax=Microbacterium hominis TaxID=162426 RepID=UPI00076876C1|nr:hypothetical protein [Microbacterium hominis]KXC05559.1 hypothetical protein MhomT_10045 [Microbacterium hominis]
MAIPTFDDLWAKAQIFARRSLSDETIRDFDERSLWATTALEFLAKAALAHISPLLIIPPDADGKHILATLGVIAHDGADIQTIQAKALWARAEKTFRPFSGKEAAQFSSSRNEYLHGGGSGRSLHPEDVWWGKLWNQASILVVATDKDLHSLVGGSLLTRVEDYLAQHKDHVQEHVAALLERARQRLDQRDNPGTPAALRDELTKPFDPSAGLTYISTTACPVCGDEGSLEGEDYGDVVIDYPDPEDGFASPTENLSVYAIYFGCPNCHLALDRVEFLEQADVPTTFTVEREYEPDDYDYGND